MNTKRPAIFIDRDGTLIEEVNFLSRVEDLRVFPFTNEAVSRLKKKGYLIIVVTNQSGIARKKYDEAAMHNIHDAIQQELAGAINAFYYCPHLPDAGCECRKPGQGMIKSAMADFDIDMSGSWMIGDKRLDIETGFKAGIKTALVKTGYGSEHINKLTRLPDIVVEDLLGVANYILGR